MKLPLLAITGLILATAAEGKNLRGNENSRLLKKEKNEEKKDKKAEAEEKAQKAWDQTKGTITIPSTTASGVTQTANEKINQSVNPLDCMRNGGTGCTSYIKATTSAWNTQAAGVTPNEESANKNEEGSNGTGVKTYSGGTHYESEIIYNVHKPTSTTASKPTTPSDTVAVRAELETLVAEDPDEEATADGK